MYATSIQEPSPFYGPGPLQSADGVVVDHFQVHLVADQLPDVGDAVLDHGWSAGGGGARCQGLQHMSAVTSVSPAQCVEVWCSGVVFHLSRERPQAMTETSSGSPIGSNISGRNTPEFPTSTHFFNPAHTHRDAHTGRAQSGSTFIHAHSWAGRQRLCWGWRDAGRHSHYCPHSPTYT